MNERPLPTMAGLVACLIALAGVRAPGRVIAVLVLAVLAGGCAGGSDEQATASTSGVDVEPSVGAFGEFEGCSALLDAGDVQAVIPGATAVSLAQQDRSGNRDGRVTGLEAGVTATSCVWVLDGGHRGGVWMTAETYTGGTAPDEGSVGDPRLPSIGCEDTDPPPGARAACISGPFRPKLLAEFGSASYLTVAAENFGGEGEAASARRHPLETDDRRRTAA